MSDCIQYERKSQFDIFSKSVPILVVNSQTLVNTMHTVKAENIDKHLSIQKK